MPDQTEVGRRPVARLGVCHEGAEAANKDWRPKSNPWLVAVVVTLGAFLFAWRKLKVGAPTPGMAIDEAKKIRGTITTSTGKRS